MAGRDRMPHPMLPAHGPIPGSAGFRGGPGPFGPGLRPGLDMLPPSPAIVEEKLATQHAEIQSLLTENQRLAATHVALKQELTVAQQEAGRLAQAIEGTQVERERQHRALAEKCSEIETELRAMEPLQFELKRAQTDAQNFHASRQELYSQIQQLNQELGRARVEAQTAPAVKGEIEGLREEIQRARTAFEFEKKANADLLEQRASMENNLVSMAREVEKLRADLTNAEKKARVAGGYGAGYGSEPSYTSVPLYGEQYGMGQRGGGGAENPGTSGSSVPPWGGYDVQVGAMQHARR